MVVLWWQHFLMPHVQQALLTLWFTANHLQCHIKKRKTIKTINLQCWWQHFCCGSTAMPCQKNKMQQSFCGIGGSAAVVAIPCSSSKAMSGVAVPLLHTSTRLIVCLFFRWNGTTAVVIFLHPSHTTINMCGGGLALPMPPPFCRVFLCRGITLCAAALCFVPKLGDGVLLCRSFYCCIARCAAAFFLHEVFFAVALASVVPWHWWLHCVLSQHWQLRSMALAAAFCVVPQHCHFLECCNTRNSPDVFFSLESSTTDAPFCRLHIKMPLSGVSQHPRLSGSSLFFSGKPGSQCTFLEVPLFYFFIALRCNYPERHNTCQFPEVPFSSPESGATVAMFFCTGSMQVAAQCLQVDCVFGKATGHLFDL